MVVAYDADRDRHSLDRLNVLAELRLGIPRGELEVHYQPQCDCDTGALVGLEALVRWRHPLRGLLYPDGFIPAVETTSVVTALATAVLDAALGQLAWWRAEGIDVTLAVNVSARQMTDPELPGTVATLLAEYAISPRLLTLEVTESSMMADRGRTSAVLVGLASVGVGPSIDDFGAGYSSLRTSPGSARTSSRLIAPSSWECRPIPTTPSSCVPSSISVTAWVCASLPRGWKPPPCGTR